MADLSKLNEQQKEVYNTYIANDVSQDDAYGLVTGTITQQDYFQKLDNKVTPKDENELLQQEGYDTELIQKTGKKIKEKSKDAYNYGIMDSPEDIYNYNAPTQEEIYNFSGIRTDSDKEAPGSIRMALSYALPGEGSKIKEGRRLFKEYLVNEKGIKPEEVEKFGDKIELKYQQVGSGREKYNALVYKIPKELGGDGMYYAFNSPKLYPTTGDFKAITGDAIPVSFAITGGVAGSTVGPAGTVTGSAGMTFAGELTKLYVGRKVYGLHSDMSDEEFDKAALAQAGLSAGIDLIATPAFLGLGQIIKKGVLTAPADKLSGDTIKKFVKAGGNLDSEMTKALDDARQILIKNGVDEKVADEYLAISVANAIPEAAIFEKAGQEGVFAKILNQANKRVQANDVENKVLKSLTGLDRVSAKEADSILDTVKNRVKTIRESEILEVDKSVGDAYASLNRTQKSFLKDPTTSTIDDIGVTFNEINQNISKKLPVLENNIQKAAKSNRLEIVLDDKESVNVLNKIIRDYGAVKPQKLPKIDPKKATPDEIKNFNKIKARNDFYDLLNEFGQTEFIQKQLGIIKRGVQNLDKMTFQEAVTWRAFLRTAEKNTTGPLSNALRKVKSNFNTAIDRATANFPETRKIVDEYDDLLFNYRNSFLEDLSKQVGYGESSQVLKPFSLTGNNRNVFESFTSKTNESLNNAEKLGNLINAKGNNRVVNKNQINRIKAALYENYYDKVMPKAAGEAGEMTHKDFVKQFGDNYKLILGPDEINKFAKSNEAALNTYQGWVNQQAKVQKVLSEKLPTLDIKTLELGNGKAIVDEIFRKGKTQDIKGLVTSLQKVDPQLLTDVRRLYLDEFTKMTSKGVNTKTLLGKKGVEVRGMNGKLLDDFLTENRDTIKTLFNDDFFNAHRDIAKALKLIQEEPIVLGKSGSLTEAANKAGLFIDIFAGPLNHKRLIVNRLGRIYDGFDLGGDSLRALRDYDRFVQAAKNNYLGGNYPAYFDQLGTRGNKVQKKLYQKFLKAINFNDETIRKPYSLLNPVSNPLYTKEYIKEKLEGKPLDDQPTIFTPADEAINLILGGSVGPGGRGPTLPKYLDKKITPKIKRLVETMTGAKVRKEKSIEDIEREEFEKKLAK